MQPSAWLVSLPLLLPVACGRAEVAVYIAPFDGQTAVPLDLAPVVRGGAAEVPPEYPVGELIRLVDLDAGGFVPGNTVTDGDDLRFFPDTGFEPGRRYGWVIDEIVGVPHGPTLSLPDGATGTAVFATTESARPVAAGMLDGRTCVFLSAPIGEVDFQVARLEVNDVFLQSLGVQVMSANDFEFDGLVRDVGDEGASVACFATEPAAGPGATLRVWWADDDPVRLKIADGDLSEVLADLYRGRQ